MISTKAFDDTEDEIGFEFEIGDVWREFVRVLSEIFAEM